MLTSEQRSEINRQNSVRARGFDPDEVWIDIEAETAKIEHRTKMHSFWLLKKVAVLNLRDCAIDLQQEIEGAITRPIVDLAVQYEDDEIAKHYPTQPSNLKLARQILKYNDAKGLFLVPRVIITDIKSGRSTSIYDTRENQMTERQREKLIAMPSLLVCPPNQMKINPYILNFGIEDARIKTHTGTEEIYDCNDVLAGKTRKKLVEMLAKNFSRFHNIYYQKHHEKSPD